MTDVVTELVSDNFTLDEAASGVLGNSVASVWKKHTTSGDTIKRSLLRALSEPVI